MDDLNHLDKILLGRLINEAKKQRKQNVSVDVNDLVDAGYSHEEINASVEKISKLDGRALFDQPENFPDKTYH